VHTKVFDEDFAVLVELHVVDCDGGVVGDYSTIAAFGDANTID